VTDDSKASRPVAIDLAPMLTAPGVAAWQALDELADRVDIRQWMVAGGMMVMLHGQRYGVDLPRTTTDADVVVDVRAFGGTRCGALPRSWRSLGSLWRQARTE